MEVCLIAFTGEANNGNKLVLNADGVGSGGKSPQRDCFPSFLLGPLPGSAGVMGLSGILRRPWVNGGSSFPPV